MFIVKIIVEGYTLVRFGHIVICLLRSACGTDKGNPCGKVVNVLDRYTRGIGFIPLRLTKNNQPLVDNSFRRKTIANQRVVSLPSNLLRSEPALAVITRESIYVQAKSEDQSSD